jgi:tetratricopeptide (TPR) repeat protein
MYTKVAEEWLEDEPNQDPLQKDFLEKALNGYQQMAQEEGDDPELRQETARAWFRVGQFHLALVERVEAEKAYDRAIRLQRELAADFPGNQSYRHDLATSLTWRGELLRGAGRPPREVEPTHQEALKLLDGLKAEAPDRPSYRKDLARSLYNLGIVQMDTDRPNEAGKSYDHAIDILDALVHQDQDNPGYRHELARCAINRGILRKDLGQADQAGEDFRRAIGLLEGLKGTGRPKAVYRFDLAVARQNQGNLCLSRRDYSQAQEQLLQSSGLLRDLVNDFPRRSPYRKKLANNCNSLGRLFFAMGSLKEAEDQWQTAEGIFQGLLQEDAGVADYHKLLGIVLGNRALARLKEKDVAGARSRLKQAIAELREALKPNPKNPEIRQDLRNQYQYLAETLLTGHDPQGAAAAAEELAGVLPDRPLDSYYAACFLARAAAQVANDDRLAHKTRLALAEKYADRALAMLKETARRGTHGLKRLPEEQAIFGPLADRPEFRAALAALPQR